uniref:RanBD1 domain-containing protein n=1 Tax=Globodera pallida TaxID=36090 RepID=A0A183BI81_GLOPA
MSDDHDCVIIGQKRQNSGNADPASKKANVVDSGNLHIKVLIPAPGRLGSTMIVMGGIFEKIQEKIDANHAADHFDLKGLDRTKEILYSARCKLYRSDKVARKNKERDLGDIKLLFNPRSARYRCVMRCEQVFNSQRGV